MGYNTWGCKDLDTTEQLMVCGVSVCVRGNRTRNYSEMFTTVVTRERRELEVRGVYKDGLSLYFSTGFLTLLN